MDLMDNSSELVTGSSDHGLRLYDIDKGSFIRQLFNKQYGHSEWVTSCKFLKDKRVLSAGMDGVLCLWDNKRV
jgi:WD40 repeat protein